MAGKLKREPVAVGGAVGIGAVSMLLGISQALGLELTEVQIGGFVAAIIAVMTWLQRRKTIPAVDVLPSSRPGVLSATPGRTLAQSQKPAVKK